jgi:peptidoglycan/xylan/chitin deacetylase (PgdA/CDA1 family)
MSPGRATLCLTFDNLGEAAEVGAGARDPDAPLGGHPTAEAAMPAILEELASRGLQATFFVEGLNAEVYPELLGRIAAQGHEVAYHAWTHEQWGELDAAAQAENLARGIQAFERIGLRPAGFRPPGGGLGPGGVDVLHEAGLRYCSPAGGRAGVEDGVALLPFEWRHVDASCVIPDMEGPLREPQEFAAFMRGELGALDAEGGLLVAIFHPFMLDWLGRERLGSLLERMAEAGEAGVEVLRCDAAAERLLSAT